MTEKNLNKILSNTRNLERILDNLKEGIIAHDLNRRIFYFNKEAEKITGLKREDVLGKDCHEAMGGPFCGERCSFCGNKPASFDCNEYTTNFVRKDGETRHIEMTAWMMTDENGNDFGVLASFRDMTDIIDLRIKAGEMKGFSNIIGQDRKMMDVFQQIRDVAMYDSPVHIHGETGTGKELVARAIHDESPRGGAPFVPINCGALPEGLVESELFGHVKGAFSGAVRNKKGRFELANNGTIFLDEVAELPRPTQVKLLRFLQEGSLEKVGGEKSINVNVRVISATNKNLMGEVKKQNFRDDLYYRLNVIPLNLPPLRDRKNDIPLLCDYFLDQSSEINGEKKHEISNEALRMMMDYHWPGNVRELQNVIQFAIVKCKNGIISSEELPLELLGSPGVRAKRGPLKKLDMISVTSALKETGGNKVRAAKLLGVGRATLYRFLKDNPLPS